MQFNVGLFTRCFYVAVIWGLGVSLGYADQNYSAHQKSAEFINEMVEKHQFDRTALQELFAQAEKKDSILEAIARPAEKRLQWKGYRKIFLTEDRIRKGRDFAKKYRQTLERAEQAYGVPPHIITAIIGVETRYGRHMGNYRVVDALATLAFDYPRRAKFFRKELEQMLLLAREQRFDALSLKGSYAGAMGFGQFIPSSYRAYAVDFDGDGVADILNNPVDAIGSVANYFAEHKWQAGQQVTFVTRVKGDTYTALINTRLRPENTLAELKAAGVHVSDQHSLSQPAKLQLLSGDKGDEYWVTLQNFYVITRYNHSHLYAMAVHQLSQELLDSP